MNRTISGGASTKEYNRADARTYDGDDSTPLKKPLHEALPLGAILIEGLHVAQAPIYKCEKAWGVRAFVGIRRIAFEVKQEFIRFLQWPMPLFVGSTQKGALLNEAPAGEQAARISVVGIKGVPMIIQVVLVVFRATRSTGNAEDDDYERKND